MMILAEADAFVSSGVGIGAIVAGVAMLLKVCVDSVVKLRPKDKHHDVPNGTAGQMPVSFWEKSYGDSFDAGFERHRLEIKEMVRDAVRDAMNERRP